MALVIGVNYVALIREGSKWSRCKWLESIYLRIGSSDESEVKFVEMFHMMRVVNRKCEFANENGYGSQVILVLPRLVYLKDISIIKWFLEKVILMRQILTP